MTVPDAGTGPPTGHQSRACAENCIHAGEMHDIHQSQARVSVALDRTVTTAVQRRRAVAEDAGYQGACAGVAAGGAWS